MSSMFDAIKLGDIALKNRVIMAPMSRNRATPEGLATNLMATYYAQRAGAGLIVSEGMQPSIVGQGFKGSPGMHSGKQLESWQKITAAVHAAGGRIVAQLMHAGRIGHPSLYPSAHTSVAPSAVQAAGQTFTSVGMRDYPVPVAMSKTDIRQTIGDFAAAARNAIAAGFDGVELLAGNGFLLHQFLAENTNLRSDEYGGDVVGRVCFVIEVVDAVADAIGASRIGMRISPQNSYNDISEKDSAAIYSELIARLPDLAYLHIMEAGCRQHTESIRRQWQGPLILNPHKDESSGPVTPEIAKVILESGLADAVCFGALFLANPDLVVRIGTNGPYNELDGGALYGGDHRGYTDYPTLVMDAAVVNS